MSSVRLNQKANALRHSSGLDRSPIQDSLNPAYRNSGPRIMIVDDIFFNIDILKDVLQKVHKVAKHEIVEAYNGK